MSTMAVAVGSLLAALLAYVFQVFGGKVLGPEEFAPITVLWTIQFLAMQVLYQPVEHYVNREARRGNAPGLLPVLMLGLGAGLLAMVLTFPYTDRYLEGDLTYVVLSGVLVAAYASFGWVRGRLAAAEKFGLFSLVTVGEAGLRVVAAVSLMWAGALGFAVAMVCAPLVALMFVVGWSRGPDPSPMRRTITPLIAASVAAQALLGLAPLVAGSLGASAAVVSVVFMTFAMYRGPLWVLQGIMARFMPVFVDQVRDRLHDGLMRWAQVLGLSAVGLGAIAYVAGVFIAPPVLEVLLGEGFRPDGTFSGLVAAGVVLAAAGGLFNQILLALDHAGTISRVWLFSLVVAAGVTLVLPADPTLRIGVAFLVGEAIACSGLYVACVTHLRGNFVNISGASFDARPDRFTDDATPR